MSEPIPIKVEQLLATFRGGLRQMSLQNGLKLAFWPRAGKESCDYMHGNEGLVTITLNTEPGLFLDNRIVIKASPILLNQHQALAMAEALNSAALVDQFMKAIFKGKEIIE